MALSSALISGGDLPLSMASSVATSLTLPLDSPILLHRPPPPPVALLPFPSASFQASIGRGIRRSRFYTAAAMDPKAAASAAAMGEKKPAVAGGDSRMLVFVPPHPLIKHWISVLRNEQTPSGIFKSAMAELGRLLIYEASRDWLPTVSGEIQTPMGLASVEFVDPREPVTIVPILRAGLALAEHAQSVLPAIKIYHLGMRRDETTLQPSVYLNKIPDKLPEGSRVLVIDPMLATGGTIVAAIDMLKGRGIDNKQIKIISAVVAPPALQKLSEKFPGLHVYAGIIDPIVNEKGFIIPGLGDAGDRSFGT